MEASAPACRRLPKWTRAGVSRDAALASASCAKRWRRRLCCGQSLVVHLESVGIDHRDARSRGIPVVPRGDAGRSLCAPRDRLVAEASEHVLSFDWADAARQVGKVYEELARPLSLRTG